MNRAPRPDPAVPNQEFDVSVVVPLHDEGENISPLVDSVRAALTTIPSWELLLVDDGSSDRTGVEARRAAAIDPRVRLITLSRNYGQSVALQAGFDHARGAVVVTMDGDLQNDPADIPLLLRKLEEGNDLVSGYRVGRSDPLLTRRVPSLLANAILRRLTGIEVRDVGCTLKAYRREVVERTQLYSDQHRFVPILAAASCAARIAEVPVQHHPRRRGRSKYGLGRIPRVMADLLIVKMILSFHDRPLALFGASGVLALLISLLIATLSAAVSMSSGVEYSRSVVLPGVAIVVLSLAIHLVLLGALGEVLLRQWMPGHGRHIGARELTV